MITLPVKIATFAEKTHAVDVIVLAFSCNLDNQRMESKAKKFRVANA